MSSAVASGGQEESGGVAGEVQDEEDHHRDAEQDEERLPEPADEVGLHRKRCATTSMCGVCGNMSTGCTHSSR